jgi:hypothetical protein
MQEEEARLQRQQARRKPPPTIKPSPKTTQLTKPQLISRLPADEITSSRAFSTAVEQSKRPTATEQKTDSPSAPVRHFNTSRALKSVNDSSTIDFAYLPDFDPDNVEASSTLMMRVPIMPDNFSPVRTGAHAPEVETVSAREATDNQLNTELIDSSGRPQSRNRQRLALLHRPSHVGLARRARQRYRLPHRHGLHDLCQETRREAGWCRQGNLEQHA